MSKLSGWEATLLFQIKAVGLPEPTREYRLTNKRRWRFDFAWLEHKLLVEVHGGTGTLVQGRHVRGKHVSPEGFENDREKMNEAVLLGFRVLEMTGRHVKSGKALEWIEKGLDKLGD